MNIVNDYSHCFIFDQQKGLESAIKELIPDNEHRFCVQHIYRNFKKVHKSKHLKDLLWQCARASNNELYNIVVEELQATNLDAYNWLVSHTMPRHWCQAFFRDFFKCDMLCNNLSESFNSFILEVRDKPIISLLEGIQILMMERIRRRRIAMSKQPEPNCPAIRKLVEKTVEESRRCKPIWNGDVAYQVMDHGYNGEQFIVDMRKKGM